MNSTVMPANDISEYIAKFLISIIRQQQQQQIVPTDHSMLIIAYTHTDTCADDIEQHCHQIENKKKSVMQVRCVYECNCCTKITTKAENRCVCVRACVNFVNVSPKFCK